MIVDDEAFAREAVRTLLLEDGRVSIVGEAAGGSAAVALVGQVEPDVLFLDVQMPRMNGFEVLEALAGAGVRLPHVVFVTAFDAYAVRAFEVLAFDYLLKPLVEERFTVVLDRLVARTAEQEAVRAAHGLLGALEQTRRRFAAVAPSPEAYLSRVAIRSVGRTVFIRVEDIDWIEADGYYARLHVGGRSHLLRETMSALEARLDPARFARVHRSAIVNVDRVVALEPYDRGHYTVVLRDGRRLRMSRSRRAQLASVFG